MTRIIMVFLSNLLALGFTSWLLFPGLSNDTMSLSLAALVLTLLNYVVRPFLMIVALPVNLITLGLFALFINAWMVMLTGFIVKGWHIYGFWPSLFTGILILLFNNVARKIARGTEEPLAI